MPANICKSVSTVAVRRRQRQVQFQARDIFAGNNAQLLASGQFCANHFLERGRNPCFLIFTRKILESQHGYRGTRLERFYGVDGIRTPKQAVADSAKLYFRHHKHNYKHANTGTKPKPRSASPRRSQIQAGTGAISSEKTFRGLRPRVARDEGRSGVLLDCGCKTISSANHRLDKTRLIGAIVKD